MKLVALIIVLVAVVFIALPPSPNTTSNSSGHSEPVYLVVSMVSRGSGHTEGFVSSGPFNVEGCPRLIDFALAVNADEVPGYDKQFSCIPKSVVENIVAENNCRLVDDSDAKGLHDYTYSCKATWLTRLRKWL